MALFKHGANYQVNGQPQIAGQVSVIPRQSNRVHTPVREVPALATEIGLLYVPNEFGVAEWMKDDPKHGSRNFIH